MSSTKDISNPSFSLSWVLLTALLWIQLFAACTYSWQFGEYYDYGWFVPPLFAAFIWRIRNLFSFPAETPSPTVALFILLLVLAGSLFCLRVVELVDPRWTLPIWIHAFVVIGTTLFTTHRLGGRRATKRIIPITLFACTALPLPTMLETRLVSLFTESVVLSSAALLEMLKMQVHMLGDRLSVMNEVVEVTDGCSGVRSAQSSLMSSLFLGELTRLKTRRRILLVGLGIAIAWALNVFRATALATIQVRKGREAFDQAHDNLGLLTYLTGLSLVFIIASLMGKHQGRSITHRKIQKTKG